MTSKPYSETGTMGSGQKITNKTVPVGMYAIFRIPYFGVGVSEICVYCLAARKT